MIMKEIILLFFTFPNSINWSQDNTPASFCLWVSGCIDSGRYCMMNFSSGNEALALRGKEIFTTVHFISLSLSLLPSIVCQLGFCFHKRKVEHDNYWQCIDKFLHSNNKQKLLSLFFSFHFPCPALHVYLPNFILIILLSSHSIHSLPLLFSFFSIA